MNPLKMSGLELIRAGRDGIIPAPSMAVTIPMTIEEAEHGFVRFSATADKNHLNPLGMVHGGFAAAVLDSVAGCAVHTTLEPMVVYSTIDLNIKMVRPVPLHITVIAEGRVIKCSKRVGTAEGTLKTPEGKLLAHATASCLITRPS